MNLINNNMDLFDKRIILLIIMIYQIEKKYQY